MSNKTQEANHWIHNRIITIGSALHKPNQTWLLKILLGALLTCSTVCKWIRAVAGNHGRHTALPRKNVVAVLDSVQDAIAKSLSQKGAGAFVLPGLLKIEKKRVPAKKAHDTIKIKALKPLKDMI